ncbi:MAG: tRNA (N(6)-L-threonylcarbamoyladenosine(37)-C(2))-methylthiotransferase [Methanothrix sp.]|nr:tRNA (N(6)-L-threonylcarbamoyladenosine(37)-C(2))-methylthiotransferase [Methanothrix sp.]OYV13682.1 MAG: MiaB-like tRNA modifying enzyme [Methanosaeta sp. ASO1]
MRFYIETYGCTANMGNSQELAEALQGMGHIPSSMDRADAIVLNTCAVTEKTERKVLRRLRQLQGDRLVVAGCLPAALPASISGLSCRGILGPLNVSSAGRIEDLFGLSCSCPEATPPSSGSLTRPCRDLCGIVNVAEGCNGACTYCIVRKARGGLKSRSPDDIAAQVERMVAVGLAEIQITAQDTAAYGSDRGSDLAQLLDRLAAIPGEFMLRVGMMNPDSLLGIQGQLLRAFSSPKIYRFLHIPVQSGSDRILEEMGRRYHAGDIPELLSAFRSSYPDTGIITDVIIGFPGETQEDFEDSMHLIERMQPDKVNITRFSARPGTPAARLYDMPDRIKKDRSREMTRLWLNIAARRNEQYEGKIISALVTERGRDATMKARADNYLGIVVEGDPKLGSFIDVLVTASNPFYLSGQLQNF